MMALLRVIRLLLLLIPIIAAARRFPQRRGAPIAPTPFYDSEDYGAMGVEDEDSGYTTTEFPYFDYRKLSIEEEATEETTEGILDEVVTVADYLADGHFERTNIVNPLNKSLSKLFYEDHPVEKYDFELCEARLRRDDLWQHMSYLNNNVYLSSMDSNNLSVGRVKPKAFTWQEAHDYCRSHCKELLTMDSFDKAYLVSSIIKSDGLLGIWTSGRRCDFPGCRNRKDVHEDGWFWSTTGQVIHTSSKSRSLDKQPYEWAKTGRSGTQPDNAELAARGVNESCLAMRYEVSERGLKLHDRPCHFKLNVVCEEPRELNELRNEM